MAEIFIFAGTSEGRELAEFLAAHSIKCHVFVATEYGAEEMEASDFYEIHVGRLDQSKMELLFQKHSPVEIFDATHPYAEDVSINIQKALASVGMMDSYHRILRDREVLSDRYYKKMKLVYSVAEAVEYLKSTDGNILLTTGVKTLSEYMIQEEIRDRIFVRIIPSIESLKMAVESGIHPSKIIAMEGPFGCELNEALINQYDIKVLVSKNSGSKGGFKEKIDACINSNITALVIEKDSEMLGISLSEAKELFVKEAKKVSIVGIGMGNDKSITVAAKDVIAKAELLIGAERMISYATSINSKARKFVSYDPVAIVKEIEKSEENLIAYLVSGDSGFYSGSASLMSRLDKDKYVCNVYPGISSVSYFSSLLGESYSEKAIYSSHGQSVDYKKICEKQEDFIIITSGNKDIIEIVRIAFDNNAKSVYVGYNLGMENEKIYSFTEYNSELQLEAGLYLAEVKFND